MAGARSGQGPPRPLSVPRDAALWCNGAPLRTLMVQRSVATPLSFWFLDAVRLAYGLHCQAALPRWRPRTGGPLPCGWLRAL